MSGRELWRYPRFSLESAIEDVHLIYRHHGDDAAPSRVITAELGHPTFSERARARLTSLLLYGVLEPVTPDTVRLTRTGILLAILPPEGDGYLAALQEAALTPELFRELYLRCSASSEEEARQYLVNEQGISALTVVRAMPMYRSAMSYARLNNAMAEDAALSPVNDSASSTTPPPADEAMPGLVKGSAGEREQRSPLDWEPVVRWLYGDRLTTAVVTLVRTPLADDVEALLADLTGQQRQLRGVIADRLCLLIHRMFGTTLRAR